VKKSGSSAPRRSSFRSSMLWARRKSAAVCRYCPTGCLDCRFLFFVAAVAAVAACGGWPCPAESYGLNHLRLAVAVLQSPCSGPVREFEPLPLVLAGLVSLEKAVQGLPVRVRVQHPLVEEPDQLVSVHKLAVFEFFVGAEFSATRSASDRATYSCSSGGTPVPDRARRPWANSSGLRATRRSAAPAVVAGRKGH